MDIKICDKCGNEKKQYETDDGRKYFKCRKCQNKYSRMYYEKNKEQLRKNNKQYSKEHYINNKSKCNEMSSNWNKNNVIRRREITKKHKQLPEVRFKESIRHRIYMFMRTINMSKNNKTFNIVGLTPNELREYIEKKFLDGMTWENYGTWHIDHKIPLVSATCEDDVYKLCYYTNLQPLWKIDNLKKGGKIKN
jgi:hypothetical protein